MAAHRHRGAKLPHLGSKGSVERIGAKSDSSFVGVGSLIYEIAQYPELIGEYHLCQIQNEVLVAQLQSIETLSIAAVRVSATILASAYSMQQVQNPQLTASPTSAYSLSQAL